ncbi:MAG: glycosyltransferase [Subtercola sp.]|nr:glycosyltransferase [Subtercola sp.]
MSRVVRSQSPLRIAVIAPLRYPIAEPHAGGLESSIWHQVNHLRRRGHHVVLCAVEGSDFLQNSPVEFVMPRADWGDATDANDIDYPAGYLAAALPALEGALDYLQAHATEFDVVHNHSLHGAPLRRAGQLGIPMISTLHTPVLPELVSAHADGTAADGVADVVGAVGGVAGGASRAAGHTSMRATRRGSRFVAVSSHTATEWGAAGITSTVLPNAVDASRWPLGPGGDDLVWFGRIVVEKGPHLAVETARLLGRRLVLAGRVGDPAYADEYLWPQLGPDVVYAGDLRHDALAELVGRSACALVTPTWQEPFGLIIVEALMCGTPVASFDAGGIAEVVRGLDGARLAPMADCTELAAAAESLIAGSRAPGARSGIRHQALERFSLDTRIGELETLYRRAVETAATSSAA